MEIKVGLYGMDQRSVDRMLTVFKMVYKGQCIATEIEDADTIIVDLDGKDTAQEWKIFREKFPDKPAVIMTESQVDIENTPYVTKPAKLPELLEALKQTSNKSIAATLNVTSSNKTHKAAESLHDRLMANSSDNHVDSATSTNNDEIYYRPEKFVQGKVFLAIRKANVEKRSIFIKCWSDRWIVISPGIDYLFENIKECQLRQLSLVKLDDGVAISEETLSDVQITQMANTPPNEIKSTPMYKFMWDISVRTARGRIPHGTSIDDLYVLQRWPNLTRLAKIPNAMRMSAFWIDQPQSIKNVAEKLGVDIKEVFTFFSAATAAGLMILAQRKSDKLVKPESVSVDKKKKGILSAIMRKIGKIPSVDEDAA